MPTLVEVKFCLVLCAVLLGPVDSGSQCTDENSLVVTRVDSALVYQEQELRRIAKEAIQKLKDVGICVRLLRVDTIPPKPTPPSIPWVAPASYLYPGEGVITYVAIPPIETTTGRYFSGVADSRIMSAVGVASPAVTTASNPRRGSAYVMAHEIAHLYGAKHISRRPNLMDPALNFYNRYSRRLGFLKETRAEVQ